MIAGWKSIWTGKAQKRGNTNKQIEKGRVHWKSFRINKTQGYILAFPFTNWLILDILLPLFLLISFIC